MLTDIEDSQVGVIGVFLGIGAEVFESGVDLIKLIPLFIIIAEIVDEQIESEEICSIEVVSAFVRMIGDLGIAESIACDATIDEEGALADGFVFCIVGIVTDDFVDELPMLLLHEETQYLIEGRQGTGKFVEGLEVFGDGGSRLFESVIRDFALHQIKAGGKVILK